jgi:hypothetical protein
MNGNPGPVAPAPSPVNGPVDAPRDWDQVDWGQAEGNKRLVDEILRTGPAPKPVTGRRRRPGAQNEALT